MRIEYRWAAGDAERIRKYAAELVALAPDVILATGGAVVAPLLQATSTVPIVFAQTPDPVGAGFVDISRPLRPVQHTIRYTEMALKLTMAHDFTIID